MKRIIRKVKIGTDWKPVARLQVEDCQTYYFTLAGEDGMCIAVNQAVWSRKVREGSAVEMEQED